MPDQPICGFDTAHEGLCREAQADRPGASRCTKHDDVRFTVCAGCAGRAFRECKAETHPAGLCAKPLCMSCQHIVTEAEGVHHGVPDHTRQPADSRPEAARVTQDVRKELIAVLGASLTASEERGLVSFPDTDYPTRVAAVALDALTTHITLKVLSGLAGAQE